MLQQKLPSLQRITLLHTLLMYYISKSKKYKDYYFKSKNTLIVAKPIKGIIQYPTILNVSYNAISLF